MKPRVDFLVTLSLVAVVVCAQNAPGNKDPGVDRRFMSSRWLEVESTPLMLFEEPSNRENNAARASGLGRIAGYELGCVERNGNRLIVSKIVGAMEVEVPPGKPGFTRRMIEQAAANICKPEERLAFVSVDYADGARWSLYPGQKPKRTMEFAKPSSWGKKR